MYVDLGSGYTLPCYSGKPLSTDLFADPDSPIPELAVGSCPYAHCYNGHALLTLGLIPGATNVRYGDIRDRVRADGSHWLQPDLRNFFNSKLSDLNQTDGFIQRTAKLTYYSFRRKASRIKHALLDKK